MDTSLSVAKTVREKAAANLLREARSVNEKLCLKNELRRYETQLIELALARTVGNQKLAAKLLGMKLTTLNAKIKRYGMDTESFKRLALA